MQDNFFTLAGPRISIRTRQIVFSLDVQFTYLFFQQIQLIYILLKYYITINICITKVLHI